MNNRLNRVPNVVLEIEKDRHYGRAVLSGIADYSRHYGPWSFYTGLPFYLDQKDKSKLPSLIDEGQIDGIIMRESPLFERIIEMGIPVIIMPYSEKYYEDYQFVPSLTGDEEKSAEVAAEHLLERRFNNYAYCGFNEFPWSKRRGEVFRNRIIKEGYKVEVFHQTENQKNARWPIEKPKLIRWLKSLPKPVGLMTCADDRSQHVVEACKTAGLRIPEEVAVIGVDNDPLICELSNPPLSSVAISFEKAGYEAASLLAKMMDGAQTPCQHIIAPVIGVYERASTNILAIDDNDVLEALVFIRDNANKIIGVEDVVGATSLSRRGLELKFRKVLNRSIYQKICQSRADKIGQILIETDFPVSRIALDLGYPSEDHIARFFRKMKGITPLNYRKTKKRVVIEKETHKILY